MPKESEMLSNPSSILPITTTIIVGILLELENLRIPKQGLSVEDFLVYFECRGRGQIGFMRCYFTP